MKAGYQLTDEDKANVQNTVDSMKTEASMYGYSDPDDYMALRFGSYCDMDNFEDYLTVCQYYNSYAEHMNDSFAPSDEEISAEYAANPQNYDTVKFQYAKFSAEAEETDEEDTSATPTYTQDAKNIAKADAAKAASEFPEDAVDGSGSYTTVNGQIPEEAADWLFDDGRKDGDIETFRQ
jgi:hypothetical protein